MNCRSERFPILCSVSITPVKLDVLPITTTLHPDEGQHICVIGRIFWRTGEGAKFGAVGRPLSTATPTTKQLANRFITHSAHTSLLLLSTSTL